jgi:hypothetical protein
MGRDERCADSATKTPTRPWIRQLGGLLPQPTPRAVAALKTSAAASPSPSFSLFAHGLTLLAAMAAGLAQGFAATCTYIAQHRPGPPKHARRDQAETAGFTGVCYGVRFL